VLKGHQLVLFSSITFQAMYKSAVLGGVLILLAISGCVRPPDEEVERRFQLPDSLGNLSIRLDSNLAQVGRWKHQSDYRCGA